jgi:hypothetical protein
VNLAGLAYKVAEGAAQPRPSAAAGAAGGAPSGRARGRQQQQEQQQNGATHSGSGSGDDAGGPDAEDPAQPSGESDSEDGGGGGSSSDEEGGEDDEAPQLDAFHPDAASVLEALSAAVDDPGALLQPSGQVRGSFFFLWQGSSSA